MNFYQIKSEFRLWLSEEFTGYVIDEHLAGRVRDVSTVPDYNGPRIAVRFEPGINASAQPSILVDDFGNRTFRRLKRSTVILNFYGKQSDNDPEKFDMCMDEPIKDRLFAAGITIEDILNTTDTSAVDQGVRTETRSTLELRVSYYVDWVGKNSEHINCAEIQVKVRPEHEPGLGDLDTIIIGD